MAKRSRQPSLPGLDEPAEKKPQTPSPAYTDRGGSEAVQGEKSGALAPEPASLSSKTIYVVDKQ